MLKIACKEESEEPQDEFTVFGRHVANKMRKMDPKQKVFVEKIIGETLFYGQMEKLNSDTIKIFMNTLRCCKQNGQYDSVWPYQECVE